MRTGGRTDAPLGCAIAAVIIWLVGAALAVGFWGLVAYVLYKFAGTL